MTDTKNLEEIQKYADAITTNRSQKYTMNNGLH